MHKKTTISILERSPLYRAMLTRMIASIDGYAMDKVCQDLDEANNILLHPTDVVVVDLQAASAADIFGFIRKLIALDGVNVIASSLQEDDMLIRQAFSIGVMGYVVKNSTYEEFRLNMMLAINGGMPISRSVVKRLVDVVRRDYSTPSAPNLSPSIFLTCQLIEELLASPFSLRQEKVSDFLSRRTGMSYPQLSIQFKKEMGINLSQYMIIQRISRVKPMLKEGNYSLSQIANMMDYSSVAHLSAQFRKITGQTPSAYKQTISLPH